MIQHPDPEIQTLISELESQRDSVMAKNALQAKQIMELTSMVEKAQALQSKKKNAVR